MATVKNRRADIRPSSKNSVHLKIILLHDDTELLRDEDNSEAHLGVLETFEPVKSALRRTGHQVRYLSLSKGLPRVLGDLAKARPNVVFHLAETFGGDTSGEPRIAAMLELLGIPHTSAGSDTLLICRDKIKTKCILRACGIPTPPYAVSVYGRMPNLLPPPPWIAKPSMEDGSIGVPADAVTSNPLALRRRIRNLHRQTGAPVLIESFVDGREFSVSVVGGKALPVSEIDFSKLPAGCPRVVSYESKWKPDTDYFRGTVTTCPAPISAAVQGQISRLGRKTLEVLGVRGYARVDLRMDLQGRLFVLEANPNPDLAPGAGLAKTAEAEGWDYDELISRILRAALERRKHL